LITIDPNNRIVFGRDPTIIPTSTVSIKADVNVNDNGLIVDHRGPTIPGSTVPAVKILTNTNATNRIGLETDGDITSDRNVRERGKNLVRFHGLLTADPTVDIET